MHAREIHHQIRVATEQRFDARRRRFSRVGQDDRRVGPGRERAVQALGGADVEVVVDHDGKLPLGGDLEELLELRPARITVDLPRELADVHLAERARAEPVDLALEAVDGGRIGDWRAGDHEVGIFLLGVGDPRGVVLLNASHAQQQHLAHVVALGRRGVGVDRRGVGDVRVCVDQGPRVLGGHGRREREQDEQDEGEHHGQITPSRASALISADERPSAPYTSWL